MDRVATSCCIVLFFCLMCLFQGAYCVTTDHGCTCTEYKGCEWRNKCYPENKCTRENVALGKRADMSSIWMSSILSDSSGQACVAVNGNTNTKYVGTADSNPNCIYSETSDEYPWWTVDLGQNYTITAIRIYKAREYTVYCNFKPEWDRGGSCNFFYYNGSRLSVSFNLYGLSSVGIFVDNILCGSIETVETTPNKEDVKCRSALTGRLIKIAKNSSYLSFCEVEVWVCVAGFFGPKCNQTCGHCNGGNKSCDRYSGHCPTGCEDGFQSSTCKIVCNAGSYGANCQERCGNCHDNAVCDAINGMCNGGCKEGFDGILCNVCDEYHYGNKCSNKCGHCVGGTCNNISGECPDGCLPGYWSSTCNQVVITDSKASIVFVAGIAVGVVASLALIAASIVLCIRCRRLKTSRAVKEQQHQIGTDQVQDKLSEDVLCLSPINSLIAVNLNSTGKHHNHSEETDKNELDVHLYDLPSDTASEIDEKLSPVYGNIQSSVNIPTVSDIGYVSTMRMQNALSDGSTSDNSTKEFEKASGIASKTEFSNQLYRHDTANNNQPEVPPGPDVIRKSIDITESQDDVFADDKDVIYNNEDIYANYTLVNTTVQLDELQRSLLDSLSSGLLGKQFKELPQGTNHSCIEGTKPENRRKNRFKSLCPYDYTRVKLQRPEGDSENDYINASYIKGFQREKTYIATQGPRTHTVDDMWLMIWQENVTQIVMLTNIQEGGKDKCEEYWPANGTTKTYGNISVTGLNVEERADFIIRTFSLRFQEKPLQHQVDQYHFMTWPDHGIPTALSLVDFWRYIKGRALPNVPQLVHCSAGVGRTGTYIALDVAMEMAVCRCDVIIHNIVAKLREDRCFMVQAEAQYKFLYEVILEAYTSRASRMTFDQFEDRFKGVINVCEPNDVIDKEFKVFQHMGKYVPKPKHDIATRNDNMAKNRNPDSIPDDLYLANLKVPVKGRNSYINAVFLSNFKRRRGTILTQLPLPDTLLDIWRLVDEQEVNTIVSIGAKNDQESVEDFCQFWPKTANSEITVGPYSLTLTTATSVTEYFTSFQLQLKTVKRTRDIRLLHYCNWASEIPEDTSDLIHLVEYLHSSQTDEDRSPVLIQCIDGAAKSGLFCILCDVISRALHDHEIDIYLAARHVQMVRPQAVTSQVQYRYCYRVAQDYQRSLGVYQNA